MKTHTWISCEKGARLYTSLDIVKVPNLIQFSVLTLNNGVDSSGGSKSCTDCSSSVCGGSRRDNPSGREELLDAQLFKKALNRSTKASDELDKKEGL